MYIEGKGNWLNNINNALKNYNNRVHGTTKMTPFEASNDKSILSLIPSNNNKLPKFQVGDFVRVPDKRSEYSKGYTTNWNRELLKIHSINTQLLDLIKEPMYIEGRGNWLNNINNALKKYNNRVHGTTKMTPFEASIDKPIPSLIPSNNNKLPKFQVGDFVRVPDKRSEYSKGYTTNWNRELLKIHSINKTNPVTYTLEDENKEIIQGKYYEQELLRSIFNFDSNNKTLESMKILHKKE